LTVKFTKLEGPTVGTGLRTLIVNGPGKVIAEAGTTAVSCVELTKVDGNAVPLNVVELLKSTIAPLRKPEPFTVRVKFGSPELALVGEMVVMVGAGVKPPLKEKWKNVPPPRAIGLGSGGPKELTMM